MRILAAIAATLFAMTAMAQVKIYDPAKEYPESGDTFLGHTFTSKDNDYRLIQQAVWRACEAGEGEVHIARKYGGSWWQPGAPIVVDGAGGHGVSGIKIKGTGGFPILYLGTGPAFKFVGVQESTVEGLGIALFNSDSIGFKFGEGCSEITVRDCRVRTKDFGPVLERNIGFQVGPAASSSDIDFEKCVVRYEPGPQFQGMSDSQLTTVWSRGHVGFQFLGGATTSCSVRDCKTYGMKFGFTNFDVNNNFPNSTPGQMSDFYGCDASYTGCVFYMMPESTPFIQGGSSDNCGSLLVFGYGNAENRYVGKLSLDNVKFEYARNTLNSQMKVGGVSIIDDGRIIGYNAVGSLSIKNCSFRFQTHQSTGTGQMFSIKGEGGIDVRRNVTIENNRMEGFVDNWVTSLCWNNYISGDHSYWKIIDLSNGMVYISN